MLYVLAGTPYLTPVHFLILFSVHSAELATFDEVVINKARTNYNRVTYVYWNIVLENERSVGKSSNLSELSTASSTFRFLSEFRIAELKSGW